MGLNKRLRKYAEERSIKLHSKQKIALDIDDDFREYAMKVLKKQAMKKRNQVNHIKAERKIMELIDFPFIVKLKYAFQNEEKLYMVMDYCPGGELFFHIQRVERFNEEAVKFYGAQLVLALDHLHRNNIIYRE